MKRVVVTGIGVVSCLGNNQDEVYKSLLNAKSGITFSEEYKEYNLKSHVHGKPNIKLEDHIDRKTIRFMGSGSAYNYIAMKEAIKDSGLEESEVSNFKTGIVMGSGGPSIENVFLEEDCDAAIFIRESHKAGYKINFAAIPELPYNTDAPVRSKDRFCNWR